MAEATGIEPVRVYGPRRFQDAFLDLPDYFRINYKLVGIEGLEPPRISPRASKTRTAANYVICPIKWSE